MRRTALLLTLLATALPAPAPAQAAPTDDLDVEIVAVVEQEDGAFFVAATCAAYAEPDIDVVSVEVWCSFNGFTEHWGNAGLVTATTVFGSGELPLTVCAVAKATRNDLTTFWSPTDCTPYSVTVESGAD